MMPPTLTYMVGVVISWQKCVEPRDMTVPRLGAEPQGKLQSRAAERPLSSAIILLLHTYKQPSLTCQHHWSVCSSAFS